MAMSCGLAESPENVARLRALPPRDQRLFPCRVLPGYVCVIFHDPARAAPPHANSKIVFIGRPGR